MPSLIIVYQGKKSMNRWKMDTCGSGWCFRDSDRYQGVPDCWIMHNDCQIAIKSQKNGILIAGIAIFQMSLRNGWYHKAIEGRICSRVYR